MNDSIDPHSMQCAHPTPQTLTPANLAEIAERVEKATKGPWGLWSEEGQTKSGRYRYSVCRNDLPLDGAECDVGPDEGDHVCIAEVRGKTSDEARANALLISACRQDIPALISHITAQAQEIERLKTLCSRLTREASGHAMEARTANASLAECYQAATGSTGEPGNWNGANPVRERITALTEERDRLREALSASKGYLMNALIDLETGTGKQTTIATLKGGIRLVDTALGGAAHAPVKRCHRLTCGLREMQTIPPMNPPLMVCDQPDCDRTPVAYAKDNAHDR